MAQRRADGLGALAAGADRLGCRCGTPRLPARETAASAVIIHVIAEQSTVEGTGDTPAAMIGYEGLIPAELIAELAQTAEAATVDPSRRRARRSGLPAVEGVGRLRPPPRPDLPLPELRRNRPLTATSTTSSRTPRAGPPTPRTCRASAAPITCSRPSGAGATNNSATAP